MIPVEYEEQAELVCEEYLYYFLLVECYITIILWLDIQKLNDIRPYELARNESCRCKRN